MEASSKLQIKVGVFLTIGLFVILASIFFWGADRAFFTTYIRVQAHFDHTQGLAPGSVVSLSGVTVGNVESIDFLPDRNSLNVVMKINSSFKERLRKGSMAEIRTLGALGDKFVYISPGSPEAEMIQEGEILEVAKASDLIGIISERGSETHKVFEILNNLSQLTKDLSSENRVNRILSNLDTATTNLNLASKEAQKLMGQLNTQDAGSKFAKSAQRLETILTKIENGEGTLGALINDPSVHNQLKALLGAPSRNNNIKSLLRTSIEKEKK